MNARLHMALGAGILGGLLLAGATARPARACGGFFTTTTTASTEAATVSDIRVLLVKGQGTVDQVVQVGYSGKATEFAWIYPVPSNPQVSEVPSAVLGKLEELTRPKIYITTYEESGGGGSHSSVGFGCAASSDMASSKGGAPNEEVPDVKVWQNGQVGAFVYVVLSATKTSDLTDWLNSNGFAVPSKNDILDHYVALGWYFVAMKVSVLASQSGDVPSTTTIRLHYAADEVRYPSRMIASSPAAKVSIEFYLVSTDPTQELVTTSFGEVDFDGGSLEATSSTTHNYDALFDSQVAGGALVREVSLTQGWTPPPGLDWIPGSSVLTRLRTRLPREALSRDIVFKTAQATAMTNQYNLTYYPNQSATVPLALVFGVGAWRLGKVLRRRLARGRR
jgi:hypothetical protein